MRVITKIRKAAKQHGCEFCGLTIRPGSVHASLVLLDGGLRAFRLCLRCEEKVNLVIRDGHVETSDIDELFDMAEAADRAATTWAHVDVMIDERKEGM